MWTALTQLNLLAGAITALAGGDDIQSVHLAEALHVSPPRQVNVEFGRILP